MDEIQAVLVKAGRKDLAKEYYKKIYPKVNDDDITEVSKAYVTEQKKKCYLATVYPEMKIADIEILSQMVTDEEIEQYERDRGNR